MSLEGIIYKNRILTPISNDKMTHLAYHCVTMKELMYKFNENKYMSDVIYENCSKISGKISKDICEKH